MDFEEALGRLGFSLERRAREAAHWVRRPSPHLAYWVHAYDDGTALFTWEFAIAEYVATLGLQVGSDEHLNTFLYPREDARGPQDPAWLAAQMDRAEETLRRVTFLPEG